MGINKSPSLRSLVKSSSCDSCSLSSKSFTTSWVLRQVRALVARLALSEAVTLLIVDKAGADVAAWTPPRRTEAQIMLPW